MEAKYVCTKECYANRLCRLGDIVGAEVYNLAPTCFTKLKSTRKADIKEEVNDIIESEESPKKMSNYEILVSRKANVNGMKKE